MAGVCEGLAVNGTDVDVDDGVVVQADVGGGKGRGLVATRHFRKGETLLKEKPVVCAQFCWNECSGYRCCHHCLEPLETTQENAVRLTGDPSVVVPYTTEACPTKTTFHTICTQCHLEFCSQQCLRDALDSYHQVLCMGAARLDPGHPLNVLTEVWKKIHYPPETASITLLVRILATIAQMPSQEESESLAQRYLSTFTHSAQELQLNICHKLLGEQFSQQLETLRLATGKVFSTAAENNSSLQWFLTPEGFASLFALVGRNGQGIGTSPFGQYVKNVDKLSSLSAKAREEVDALIDGIYGAIENFAGMMFINNEGSGLYWMHSAANHSCLPNAVVEFPFNNNQLVINATQDISPGEEILISYLDECQQNQSRHSRQKYLRDNYLFTCQCPKCSEQAGDPDVTSDEEMTSEEEEGEEDE